MNAASSEKISVFEVVLKRTLRLSVVLAVALFVLFLLSGVTFVAPGEVALVYRFGKLVSENPPGLLITLPAPFDEVVRVDTSKVRSVQLADLWLNEEERTLDLSADDRLFLADATEFRSRETLSVSEGYAITRDLGVIHLRASASYEITGPAAFMTNFVGAEELLRVVASSALSGSVSARSVDEALYEKQSEIIAIAKTLAQQRLDELEAGITIKSITLEDVSPPRALEKDFEQAANASISGETFVREAQAYRNRIVPEARSEATAILNEARGNGAQAIATAKSEVAEFANLVEAYREDPVNVWNRLYFETMDRVLSNAGNRHVLSAPESEPVRIRIIVDGKN